MLAMGTKCVVKASVYTHQAKNSADSVAAVPVFLFTSGCKFMSYRAN